MGFAFFISKSISSQYKSWVQQFFNEDPHWKSHLIVSKDLLLQIKDYLNADPRAFFAFRKDNEAEHGSFQPIQPHCFSSFIIAFSSKCRVFEFFTFVIVLLFLLGKTRTTYRHGREPYKEINEINTENMRMVSVFNSHSFIIYRNRTIQWRYCLGSKSSVEVNLRCWVLWREQRLKTGPLTTHLCAWNETNRHWVQARSEQKVRRRASNFCQNFKNNWNCRKWIQDKSWCAAWIYSRSSTQGQWVFQA